MSDELHELIQDLKIHLESDLWLQDVPRILCRTGKTIQSTLPSELASRWQELELRAWDPNAEGATIREVMYYLDDPATDKAGYSPTNAQLATIKALRETLEPYAASDGGQAIGPGVRLYDWMKQTLERYNGRCLDLLSLYENNLMNAFSENLERLGEYLDEADASVVSELLYALCAEPQECAHPLCDELVQCMLRRDDIRSIVHTIRKMVKSSGSSQASGVAPSEALLEWFASLEEERPDLFADVGKSLRSDAKTANLDPNSSIARAVSMSPSIVEIDLNRGDPAQSLLNMAVMCHSTPAGHQSSMPNSAQISSQGTATMMSISNLQQEQKLSTSQTGQVGPRFAASGASGSNVDQFREAYLLERQRQEAEFGKLYETYSSYAARLQQQQQQQNSNSNAAGIAALPASDLTQLHMMNASYLTSLMNLRRTAEASTGEGSASTAIEPPVVIKEPQFKSMI